MSERTTTRRTVALPARSTAPKPSTRRARPVRPSRDSQPARPNGREAGNSDAEMEFMLAMQDYKISSGRMFPTWSEVLEVLKGLGYAKNP